ncbi:MAG: LamG domain-containing protein [bacterium]|nr:LamG domain-containing protein [bacterium]
MCFIGGSSSYLYSTSTIPLNTWTHIVAVGKSGEYIKLYINGQLDAQLTTGVASMSNTADNVLIGKLFGECYLNGAVDEVKVYDRVLNEEEIYEDYLKGLEVAKWCFDAEEGTTAADSSCCSNNDGTLTNMDTSTCWVDGRIGHALKFDGDNDYVDCGNGENLQITDEVTLEAWVKPTGSHKNNAGSIVSKAYSNYVLQISTVSGSDKALCFIGGSSSYLYSTSTIPLNTWTHIVAVGKSGEYIRLYINGQLNAQKTSGVASMSNTSDNILIGKRFGGYYLNGVVDEVKVYNRALSSEEINKNFIDEGGLYGFGCEEQPTGNPIGGGNGYNSIINEQDADYSVSTKSELLYALANAISGDIVYIGGTAQIDLTGYEDIWIAGGVTLASDRGRNGSSGALLYTTQYATFPLFLCSGADVRVTGLRLCGPDPEIREVDTTFPNSRGIKTAYSGLEVDNCEISAWSHAGIYLDAGATDAYVHHNYIHHCQRAELGYGVVLGYGNATAIIEANQFDWCRHGIAGSGVTGNSYEARYNLVLENANGHSFDMHGGADRQDGTDIAGDTILIHHNTFKAEDIWGVGIRGIPNNGAWINNNWFFHQTRSEAVHQANAFGNMDDYLNLYTLDRKLKK